MKKKKTAQHQDIFVIAILSLLTVLAWIGFNAYHSYIDKKETTIDKKILQPINPNIDLKIVEELQKKEFLSQEEINQAVKTAPSKESSPTATPTSSFSPASASTPASSSASASASPVLTSQEEATTSSASANYENVSQE